MDSKINDHTDLSEVSAYAFDLVENKGRRKNRKINSTVCYLENTVPCCLLSWRVPRSYRLGLHSQNLHPKASFSLALSFYAEMITLLEGRVSSHGGGTPPAPTPPLLYCLH